MPENDTRYEKITELKAACEGVVEFMEKYCNPYDKVIIENDRISLVSNGFEFELPEKERKIKPSTALIISIIAFVLVIIKEYII